MAKLTENRLVLIPVLLVDVCVCMMCKTENRLVLIPVLLVDVCVCVYDV